MKQAALAMAAVLASFGIMYLLCTRAGVNASPAILAAALAVGLARKPEQLEARAILARFLMLPLIGLAAAAVGLAFRALPPLGAVLFCVGIALSVYLRNFGERASALGRTIALPFITMLVVPVQVNSAAHPGLGALLVLAAGASAFMCTAVIQWFA
ncbi:MAG TPA: hypothetical protein VMB20_05275 [Candidatus Acidoferrum sp.]|nr:hypothetical protein [Candidatus Acidoferrum sp.]